MSKQDEEYVFRPYSCLFRDIGSVPDTCTFSTCTLLDEHALHSSPLESCYPNHAV